MADLASDPGRGPKASHALTFTPDHPVGAGQSRHDAYTLGTVALPVTSGPNPLGHL